MKLSALFCLIVFTLACSSTPEERSDFSEAQAIVDQLAAKHPNVLRLTIHAIPSGARTSRIIACNLRGKIGKASDPEDLDAMKTGEPVVLKEGVNLDVTMALRNAAKAIHGAAGITIQLGPDSDDTGKAKALAVGTELEAAINAAAKPLW